MIKTYPEFSKLELALRQEVLEITSHFEPYSDFNFTSLYCWDVDNSTELSLLNGNLVIKLPGYLDGRDTYSLLGTNKIDESVEILLNDVGKLEMVPAATVAALSGQEDFQVIEDRDNFDYVYELEALTHLAGGHYKKKRNKNNVFIKDHEDYELEVRVVHDLDEQHAETIRQLDRDWAKVNPRDEGDILSERKAIGNLLDNFSHFQAVLIEIWVDGEMKAFSVNEVIDNEYAICHFEKALKVHHDNIYTFLAVEVARTLKDYCKLINWEQDLGLEGLRQSKSSYQPVKMLKKYAIYPHVRMTSQQLDMHHQPLVAAS